jgi:hypothetical protein
MYHREHSLAQPFQNLVHLSFSVLRIGNARAPNCPFAQPSQVLIFLT